MAAKRISERRQGPGEGVAHGTGKRSMTAAGAGARARAPHGRAGRVRPFSPGPPPPDDSGAVGPPDFQWTLSVLIVQQWTETLTGEFDWADWPLIRYSFSEAFLSGLERQADLDTVAWVCAMVACGLASELPALRLQPLDMLSDGRCKRDDGAQGQRCSVESGRGADSHLDFWHLTTGVIEFDRFMAVRLVHNGDAESGSGPAAC